MSQSSRAFLWRDGIVLGSKTLRSMHSDVGPVAKAQRETGPNKLMGLRKGDCFKFICESINRYRKLFVLLLWCLQ